MKTLILSTLMFLLLVPFTGFAESSSVTGSVKVDGLSCPFCAHGLNKKVSALNWIQTVEIYVDAGRADFSVKEGANLDVRSLRKAVGDGGFTPREITLTVLGEIKKIESEIILVLSSGTRLTIDPSDKRTELLNKLDKYSKRVQIEGRAKTKGEKIHLSVVNYKTF